MTGPVSYTHLRAHETEADLVCRLLLEKKKPGFTQPLSQNTRDRPSISRDPRNQSNQFTMGNQHSNDGDIRHARPFARGGGALGLSKSELDKRCQPSG